MSALHARIAASTATSPRRPTRRRSSRRLHSFYDFPDGEAKLERFLEATHVSARDHALFLLLARTAIRGVSALNARWRDFAEDRGDVVLWTYGKTVSEGEKKWKFLQPSVVSALEAWRAKAAPQPDDHIFRIGIRQVRKLFAHYKRAAGISDPLTVHSLRHTAITQALLRGGSVLTVQGMADHETTATTLRYAHAVRRREDAAERLLG